MTSDHHHAVQGTEDLSLMLKGYLWKVWKHYQSTQYLANFQNELYSKAFPHTT